MTIHITSMRDCDPAEVKSGVIVKCQRCDGIGELVSVTALTQGTERSNAIVKCSDCNGRGEVRYHDLTKGALANPYKPRGEGLHGYFECNVLHDYELHLRMLGDDEAAALSAIQPGDVLVHDGSELGAACAEVVRRLAMERAKA